MTSPPDATQHIRDQAAIELLILAALREEIEALLDVTRGELVWNEHETEDRIYFATTLSGSHGPLRVVATWQPRMGPQATVAWAGDLVDRFAPRVLAMCGVCAGHPEDTTIGDVIIADRVFGHDEGKWKGSEFYGDLRVSELREDWVPFAQRLAGPAKSYPGYGEADEEMGRRWFLEQIYAKRRPLNSVALSRYLGKRRAEVIEALEEQHLTEYDHERGFVLTHAGLKKVRRRLAVHGSTVSKLPYYVQVGPIGSGSSVMADPGVWRRIEGAGMRKVLGVEMEAAALGYVASRKKLPFVVVKGVMDHADQYKADGAKAFAARASAAVLVRFVRAVVEPGGDARPVPRDESAETSTERGDRPAPLKHGVADDHAQPAKKLVTQVLVEGDVRRPKTNRSSPIKPELAQPVQSKRRLFQLTTVAASILLLLALVMVFWIPRFEGLRLVDQRDGGLALRLEGTNLESLHWMWLDPWLEALSEFGLQKDRRAPLVVAEEGRALLVPISADPGADLRLALMPGLGRSSTTTVELPYDVRLSFFVVSYKDEDNEAMRTASHRMTRWLSEWSMMQPGATRVVPEANIEIQPAQKVSSESSIDLKRVLRRHDIISASAFFKVYFSAIFDKDDGTGTSPFQWVACNVGSNNSEVYSSALFTPTDTELATWNRKHGPMTPTALLEFARSLPEDERLVVQYNHPGSTSGSVVPCLTWHDAFTAANADIRTGGSHDQTIDQVLAPTERRPSKHRIGAVYLDLLDDAVEPGGRHEGKDYELLWRHPGIPHGGLFMWSDLNVRKRDIIARGLVAMLEKTETDMAAIEWPKMRDVHGFSTCSQARFDVLEEQVLTGNVPPECLPKEMRRGLNEGPVVGKDVVRVAAYDYPPFVDGHQFKKGLLFDFIDLLNKRQDDYRFEAVLTTPRDRHSDFHKGLFDLLAFESVTWGWGDSKLHTSEPLLQGGERYIALAVDGRGQEFFSSVTAHRLALVDGYHYRITGYKHNPSHYSEDLDIVLTDGPRESLDAVLDGRADIAILSDLWLRSKEFEILGLNKRILISNNEDQLLNLGLLVRDTSPVTEHILNALVDELRDDQAWLDLQMKHGISSVPMGTQQ